MSSRPPDIRYGYLALSALFGFLLISFLLIKAFPAQVGEHTHVIITQLARENVQDVVSSVILSLLALATGHFYRAARDPAIKRVYYTRALAHGYEANFLSHVIAAMPPGAPGLIVVIPPVDILSPQRDYVRAFHRQLNQHGFVTQDGEMGGRRVTSILAGDRLVARLDVARTLLAAETIIEINLGRKGQEDPRNVEQRRARLYDIIASDFRAALEAGVGANADVVMICNPEEARRELERRRAATQPAAA
ncbi:hypothetical protein ACERNI_13295 [Camelimonas sp. ID_303_24]